MSGKNCFIKISGDILNNYDMLRWIKELSRQYFTVVCVGGGTQINQAFEAAGFPVKKFGLLGRETETLAERQLARDILEKNQVEIQHHFAALDIRVKVVIPVMEIGTVPCHINGDQLILVAYHGFDVLYVVTAKDKVESKKSFFSPYQKICVIGF